MRRLFFFIDSDPLRSGKAAEAIRIAAGISAWKKAAVNLYLHGPAATALTQHPDDWMDGDLVWKHLSSLQSNGAKLLVSEQNLLSTTVSGWPSFQPISLADVAQQISGSDSTLRF